ncbi:hypothetical protein DQ354_11635 [Arthrobacter sp. AQ5-06]|nr:hypothetical protein DQ354_11635 [Arthrobacter sp. AQ5-06]
MPGGETGKGIPAPQFGQRAPGTFTPPAESPSTSVPPAPPAGREDVLRGAVFALAAVPLGVIAWLVLWDLGWMASLVAFIAAAGAARLYVLGTGGTISRRGVWVVVALTVVTVLLSFLGSLLIDAAKFLGGGSPLSMLADAETWDLLGFNLATNRELVDSYAGDFLLALLFSALGCFFTLRQLFAQTRKS